MTAKPTKRVVPRRTPKTPGNLKAALLKLLQKADGLVSSKELKDAIGPKWREALAALRLDGHQIDETLGASGNRSFRLNQEQPGPRYLTEPAPLPQWGPREAAVYADELKRQSAGFTKPVALEMPLYMVRQLLAAKDLPAEARDLLAEALAKAL